MPVFYNRKPLKPIKGNSMFKILLFLMTSLFFQTAALAKAQLAFEDTNGSFNFQTTVPYHEQTTLIFVRNVGDRPAEFYLDSLELNSPITNQSYWTSPESCKHTLNVGKTCYFRLFFRSQSTGTIKDTLSLSYYDDSEPIANKSQSLLSLSTDVVSPAKLEISDGETFDFGIVAPGAERSHVFTVTNTGKFPAEGMTYSINPERPFGFVGGHFPGINGTCGNTLAHGERCTMVVNYWPTLPGNDRYIFGLYYFDGGSNLTSVIDLHGTCK
jgi:hypothetical protein